MKLTFTIDYRTNWGESLFLAAHTPLLGDGCEEKAVKMTVQGSSLWSVSVDLPDSTAPFSYRYIVRDENGQTKREWGHPHTFTPAPGARFYNIFDRWQDQPFDKPFYSSAFTECICRHQRPEKPYMPASGQITLCVAAPMLAPGQVLALCGATEGLGLWDPRRARRMDCSEYPVWKVNVPVSEAPMGAEFKFVVLDAASGELVSWEGGDNRRIDVQADPAAATVLAGMRFINDMPLWRGAGTAIPVFSLRSDDDFGVGDFHDLFKLIDWAVATGQTFVQLLPVNDTTMTHTWTDSYPYNANSTFALHPMYLRLEELGTISDKAKREEFERLRRELNALPTVDYERVNSAKTEYVRQVFATQGQKTMKSDEFKSFVDRNSHWLLPYAAFCALRDRLSTPEFDKWGEFAVFSDKVLKKVLRENKEATDMAMYIQFHLDRQMRAVHDYANARGVALKGDIPIGISRTSADAWVNPSLFYLDCQAGAPPDDFSILGQNWGLPTYNWEVMNRDGFAWWKARFGKMAEFFDAYRIDHVLGFFRIWQIPMDAIHGLLGIFNPALPYSVDELRYNYDFWIDVDLQTTPYIMDGFLEDFFGPYTSEVRRSFMTPVGHGRYRLLPEFDTQRKIADHFAAQPKNEKNSRIADGLMGLVDQVLFIEDPEQKGKYHPRISAQYTYIYRSLTDYERWCFDRLYNDFFYRRHNDFWYGKAMWKLPPLIDSTDMLVCAEDLGMIPACVPAVMHQLEILSLEIQRMPKDPATTFGNTWSYPYYSVCTTSTHDMPGIRGWWEDDHARSQQFFNEVLHQHGEAPYFAEPWVCDRIVDLHLKSPSMLCILPLQDWLSMDGSLRREKPAEEQINMPTNSRHYWRYRMHLSIEELSRHSDFNNYVANKIKEAGR